LECLYRYYSYGLEIKFRQDFFQDFQELCLKDIEQSQDFYGLEKLWGFLHYRKDKDTRPLQLLPQIQDILKSCPTIQEFRKMASNYKSTTSY